MLKAMVSNKTDSIIKNAKVDLSRIPPCLLSVHPHLRRVNYLFTQWKRSDEPHPASPSLIKNGWCFNYGVSEPFWSDEEIVPQRLVDLLAEDCDENNNEYHVIDNNLSHCDSDLESGQHC